MTRTESASKPAATAFALLLVALSAACGFGGTDPIAEPAPPTWQQRIDRAHGADKARCVADAAAGSAGTAVALDRVEPPTLDEARGLVPVLLGCMSKREIGDVFTVGSGSIAADCTKALLETLDNEDVARLLASEPAADELSRLEECLRENLRTNEPSPTERRAGTVPGSLPPAGLAP